ncbi:MAG: hypothetical protein KA794_07850 [Candidatus Obscuribacter sp.]|nr:hypothetical protein [Candidatus Obscuribacter sp.]
MQKSLQFTYSSINDISAKKVDNAVAKTLMHRLKVVSSDNALPINSDFVHDSAMVEVAHLPWAERQEQSATSQKAQCFDHSGNDCHNSIAVIGVGNSTGNSGLGQKLAENLPALTRQSICYFDIGTEYSQIQNCLARHTHIIIANCADLTEEPALSFLNLSKLRQAQHDSSNSILTTYEIKQPYVMRKGDGISTANQNIQIADELAYISLNRSLPRTWMFLINSDHEATNTILTTAKSNASLGQRSHFAGLPMDEQISINDCFANSSNNGTGSDRGTGSNRDTGKVTGLDTGTGTITDAGLDTVTDKPTVSHQSFAPDMEAAMPRLILRLQTLINDLLVTRD